MAEVGYASLGIIPSFDGFQSKLESGTAPGLLAAGRTGGTRFGGVAGSSAGKRFGSVFSTAAKASLLGLAGAGALAFKLGSDAIGEAREAQEVGALTKSTIKATGGAANVTAKQVGRLSSALSKKAGIDDEVIQAGANMLLTFKNVRNEQGKSNKIFDQSVGVLTDLSAAMGTEPRSAAIQLGKALNDPVKGITALTRVGVSFTDQQKKQIEQMVKAGDIAGAQKIILGELSSEFGGAAAAQADEADKLSVAWGNFKEELGTELLPMMDDVAVFIRKEGIPAVKEFSDWFTKDGIPAIKDFYDEAKPLAEKVLPAIGSALDTTKDAAKKIAPLLEGVFDGFNKLPDWVQSVIVLGAGAAALKSKLSRGGSLGGLTSGAASSMIPIRTFETNPAALGGGVGAGGAGVPAAGGKGVGVLGGLAFLAAGAQPDTIPLEQDLANHGVTDMGPLWDPKDQDFLNVDEARAKFKAMRDSGEYTAKELRETFQFMRMNFGDDFDYMSWKARQTMDHIRDATPKQLQTELVVLGVDRAHEAVEVALAPFMVGRTPAKEAQGSDSMLPAPSQVPSSSRTRGRGRGGDVNVNMNIGTVNDSKQLNKDAAAKAQQAAMGGW